MPLEEYRVALLAKRAELVAHLRIRPETVAALGPVAEEDRARAAHEEFVSLRINRVGYEQLRLVDAALERLECGDYGICIHCGAPISPKRLAAIPWASHCIRCQERIHSAELEERVA